MAALSAILIGLALAVLLVACANVAGLLTSRAPVRAREMALRLAIGGSRARLMRQLITETALVAVTGGVAGSRSPTWASCRSANFRSSQTSASG